MKILQSGTSVRLKCDQLSSFGHGKILTGTLGIITDVMNGYCRVKFIKNGQHIDSIYVDNFDLQIQQ